MNFEQLIASMTPEIYERLKTAVELGKWDNGERLSEAQKEHSLQAVIAYQSLHLTQTEHMTIAAGGALNLKPKQELKQQFADNQQGDMDDSISRIAITLTH